MPTDLERLSEDELARRVAAEIVRQSQSVSLEPIGGATIDPKKPWEKWPRKVQQFEGTIPVSPDGLQLNQFVTTRPCDIKDKDGKACGEQLIAKKVKNYHLVKNRTGKGAEKPGGGKEADGGQLDYDDTDYRYYLFCGIHGPNPPGPLRWDKDGNPL